MLQNGRVWTSQEGLWGSLWYCSLLVLVSAIFHRKRKPRLFFFKRLLLLLLFVAIDSETNTGFTFRRQQPKLRQNVRNNRFRSLGTGPQVTVIAERWETNEMSPAAALAACIERFQAQHRETEPKKSLERP